MSHLPDLISDLALILISAGIITLIFKWLKQPLVLGYIVAGILAGPYFDLFPTVADAENITIWAEIGVVFLLFALGLEFSFKKLINVGGAAFITATTEVLSMLVVGFLLGRMLGWTTMDCLFLGGMLSMSSTTIIIKAFDDLGLRNQKFTGIVFGTLVVEDLVAILMMVMLSTLAVSKNFEGDAMLASLMKLAFFLILWFLIGIYLLPTFFKKVKKLMNDETLLIISLGLCLGMVVLATHTGFSAALGAFIMGSILAETVESEHIEHVIKGLKDFFGAVFFVSVGMMVNPEVLGEYAVPVLVISFVTIVGKAFFSSFGVLLSGQSLKTSIQSGFSLAQIGEFAFIIASLGFSLGVMSEFIYPIIVAVSVITTFTTPYFIRLSEPFYRWISPRLPAKTLAFLNKYASGEKTINRESDWKQLLRKTVNQLIVYSVVLTAIILAFTRFLHPVAVRHMPDLTAGLVITVFALLAMSPFLRVVILNKRDTFDLFQRLWNDSKFNRGGLVSLLFFRILLAVFFVSFLLFEVFRSRRPEMVILAFAVVAVIFISRKLLTQYAKMEKHFLDNLNRKEEEARKKKPLAATFATHLFDRDIHLSTLVVSPDSPYIGKTLAESAFKKDFGVNVVKIIRGNRVINLPGGSDHIYPSDRIVVLGTDKQISDFTGRIENISSPENGENKDMSLRSFTVEENSHLVGKNILNSGIRTRTNCLVVGIERNGTSLMNPDIAVVFEPGDLVWIVGEPENIRRFMQTQAS